MRKRVRTLADNESEAWKLVFISREDHLYVTCDRSGKKSPQFDGMMVEDFLVTRPSNSIGWRARKELKSLLKMLFLTMPDSLCCSSSNGGKQGFLVMAGDATRALTRDRGFDGELSRSAARI